MELVITGNEAKLRRLAKELRLRIKRDGLAISESKKAAPKAEPKPKTEPVKPQAKNGSSKTTGKK